MANQNDELIETIDENGNKVTFELIDIVTVDDIEYALLLPKDVEDEEGEILVMRLKKEGDEFTFEAIEDDDEFNKVAEYIEELEDEIEE
ncbi:MAG: DUF1292 domain-containing protein [Cyanobacteria bacterium SIG29]|nr:DUF1292 domain-containing protein [Cyanobacteria bacterium SIG29]